MRVPSSKKSNKCNFLDTLAIKSGFKSYKSYLKSTQWGRTVAKYRKKQCFCCKKTKSLQLHHRNYSRLGLEIESDLVTVCNICHRLIHFYVSKRGIPLSIAHLKVRRIKNPLKSQNIN